MYDVITFGSATKDIFLRADENVVIESEKFASGKGVCFSLGSKINAEEIYFASGGGGTNVAVSFSKQGYNVAYCGKVGRDESGERVLKELEEQGVSTDIVSSTDKRPTNHSVIIDVPGLDRTILVYRGASDDHSGEDIDYENLKAKWFYIAPFSASTIDFFYDLLNYASSRGIKVMVNPSKSLLRDSRFKESLQKIDVLLLNLEEASLLTGVDIQNEEEIVVKGASLTKGVFLITQGVRGVVAFADGLYFRGRPIFPDSVDKTGAGDSFGAGFLSEFMRDGDVEKSLQLGIANSTACLQKMGAKNGLLSKGEKYQMNPILRGENITQLKWHF
jgi:ribokinase